MTTTTPTRPALAVVWPTNTFWPPNPKATALALGAMEYLERSTITDAGATTPQAIRNIKNFLVLACLCAPKPHTEFPIDVS